MDWNSCFQVWKMVNTCGNEPTFRVSTKKSNDLYTYTHQDISKAVASSVVKKMGWKVELKHHELEIYVNLSEKELLVGLPLSKNPLSKRTYMKRHGLRCSLAWVLAKMGSILPGNIVCDPMCGLGTILIEAAISWPLATYIGIDASLSQLEGCRDNVQFAQLGNRIDLLNGSVTKLPMADGSVDVILCDIPFGKKFGSYEENVVLYPVMLKEMKRVLTNNGRVIIMTSENNLMEWVFRRDKNWLLEERKFVQLGVTEAYIYNLKIQPEVKDSPERSTKRIKLSEEEE